MYGYGIYSIITDTKKVSVMMIMMSMMMMMGMILMMMKKKKLKNMKKRKTLLEVYFENQFTIHPYISTQNTGPFPGL